MHPHRPARPPPTPGRVKCTPSVRPPQPRGASNVHNPCAPMPRVKTVRPAPRQNSPSPAPPSPRLTVKTSRDPRPPLPHLPSNARWMRVPTPVQPIFSMPPHLRAWLMLIPSVCTVLIARIRHNRPSPAALSCWLPTHPVARLRSRPARPLARIWSRLTLRRIRPRSSLRLKICHRLVVALGPLRDRSLHKQGMEATLERRLLACAPRIARHQLLLELRHPHGIQRQLASRLHGAGGKHGLVHDHAAQRRTAATVQSAAGAARVACRAGVCVASCTLLHMHLAAEQRQRHKQRRLAAILAQQAALTARQWGHNRLAACCVLASHAQAWMRNARLPDSLADLRDARKAHLERALEQQRGPARVLSSRPTFAVRWY